ncbi:MAG: 50S ribosomal protein L9 [Limisphaerales bacterium]
MAKTELILIKNVVGLGGEADQIKVAPGYARNFLVPRGLAMPVTGANRRRLEVLKQRRADREAHELNAMTDLGRSLGKLTLLVKVKTGEDGKLFGAVTAGTIADELKNQYDAAVERRKIHLAHPIKSLGDHDVELRLHPQVHVTLKVKVESTTPSPPLTEPAAAKPVEKTVKHSEKFGPGAKAAKVEAKPTKAEAKPAKA